MNGIEKTLWEQLTEELIHRGHAVQCGSAGRIIAIDDAVKVPCTVSLSGRTWQCVVNGSEVFKRHYRTGWPIGAIADAIETQL